MGLEIQKITSLTDPFTALKEPEKKVCNGQIYRYAEEAWIGSDGDVNFRHRFRWVKSLSCNDEGCNQCEWLVDDFQEQLSPILDFDSMLPHNGAKPGAYYQLKVTDYYSTDWETGICDDYTIGFEEWNEEEENR